MAANSDIVITDNRSDGQFEARIDGALAGVVEYELSDDIITLTHTRVFDEFGGRGVGGALAREALDAIRADGTRKVAPHCPFIAGWIDKHPEYADLEAENARGDGDDGDDD